MDISNDILELVNKKINDAGFYISLIYFFKIYEWFGYQYYYIFEKRKDKKIYWNLYLGENVIDN